MKIRFLVKIGFLGLLLTIQGCSSLSYYKQAISGQISLLASRQPVEKLLQAPDIGSELRQRLELSQRILAFARKLGLPVAGTFSSYADIGRPYVVWNVFAAPAFSLQLQTYCFPIAGCVAYKGFFSQAAADAYAEQLRLEGMDVFVGGVAAYSTLGWFDDPLLNTFLMRDETALASLIFHELAHKVLYVEGDTTFNESFATAVERYALKSWLAESGQEAQFEAYLAADKRRQSVIQLILEVKAELQTLYSRQMDLKDKREAKAAILSSMRQRYQDIKAHWLAGDEFAYWMQTDVNNARLGALGAYHRWVPAFEALQQSAGSFAAFVDQSKALASMSQSMRDEKLTSLASQHKPL